MDRPAPKIDTDYIIGEIARRHKLVFSPTDPAFAIITINELVLKNTLQEATKAMTATLDRFDASIERAEIRAGRILGQQIKDAMRQFRQGAQTEVAVAANQEAWRRWGWIELICAALLSVASFCLGWTMSPR